MNYFHFSRYLFFLPNIRSDFFRCLDHPAANVAVRVGFRRLDHLVVGHLLHGGSSFVSEHRRGPRILSKFFQCHGPHVGVADDGQLPGRDDARLQRQPSFGVVFRVVFVGGVVFLHEFGVSQVRV
mgnify:FL=1